jgi:hypothetical protein
VTEQANLQEQQSQALDAAHKQQLEGLAQARATAMASAQYWEGLASQATQATQVDQASVVRPPTPTVVTAAHFEFLEKVLNAQYDFHRTLMSSTSTSAESASD